MNYLKNHFNIKIALSIMALIIGVCLFILNRAVIDDIRKDTYFRAEQSAQILSQILNEQGVLDNVLLEQYSKFIESLTFPIIISNEQDECIAYKIKINQSDSNYIDCNKISNIINEMDQKNSPIAINYMKNQTQTLHFGDPLILTSIINLSFITVGFFILFILIFLWGFYFMKSNEKDLIYVGMAKETAHQIGTPLSSLMAWLELLKEKSKNEEIAEEMEKDLADDSEYTKIAQKMQTKRK